jgi:hypothetical protein
MTVERAGFRLRTYHVRPREALVVTGDFYRWAERHYGASGGRPARLVSGGVETAFLVSLPGGDLGWIGAVDPAEVRQLSSDGDVRFLAGHAEGFHCGCDHRKVVEHPAASYRGAPQVLFGEARGVSVPCPRCGVRYTVSYEEYEEHEAHDRWRSQGARRG